MTTQSLVASSPMTVKHGAASLRIPAFDFTKGALVLFMVLYHWLNYFYGLQTDIYKYLRFLTPSFIFITGFLISHVHFAKYQVGSLKLSKRLFIRGVKLLVLFIGLNIPVSLLLPSSFLRDLSSSQMTLMNLDAIFFMGTASGEEAVKIAAFTILVPIGYVLILSSLLSIAAKSFKYAFHAACIMALLCMIFLDFHNLQSSNMELITVGLAGVVLGYSSKKQIEQTVRHAWLLVLVYCAYVAAITVWNVSYYVQMVGACLTTALIYVIGVQTARTKILHSPIDLLGKYSLFAYIAQIAILQALSLGIRRVNHGPLLLAGSFVAGLALTMISVGAMDRGRSRSKIIDGAYRAIFA
jgi:peptidoglycan/LPS O-acetylase OafA/YrhL